MNAKTRRSTPTPHGRMPTWWLLVVVCAVAGVAWVSKVAI
jgi:hypothetical protein